MDKILDRGGITERFKNDRDLAALFRTKFLKQAISKHFLALITTHIYIYRLCIEKIKASDMSC